MRKLILIVLLSLPCLSPVAYSQQDMTAEVPVPDQSSSAREAGLKQAMEDILIRLTGQLDISENEVVANALNRANRYLVQYGYSRSAADELVLQATFTGDLMLEVLANAGISPWQGRRPQLLFWLAERTTSGVTLLNRELTHPLVGPLLEQAERRRLPVLLPLLDLTDQQAVSARDVWGRFSRDVRAASERYPSDGFLMARVETAADTGTTIDWSLRLGNLREQGQSEGSDEAAAAARLVDDLTALLAAEYALTEADQEERQTMVRVTGLVDLAAVLAVERALQEPVVVDEIQMLTWRPGRAEFLIRHQGSMRRLAQELTTERRLAISLEFDEAEEQEQLEYQWQP